MPTEHCYLVNDIGATLFPQRVVRKLLITRYILWMVVARPRALAQLCSTRLVPSTTYCVPGQCIWRKPCDFRPRSTAGNSPGQRSSRSVDNRMHSASAGGDAGCAGWRNSTLGIGPSC